VNKLLSTLALAWVACCALAAAQPSLGPDAPLIATEAWVRITPGSDVAAAYVTLRNASRKPVTIVSVESPAAGVAMIHETRIEGGVSRMRPHDQLVIPAGGTVKLEPEGLHIMLHGIAQLAPGASVPLVLRLANGTSIQIVAQVRPLNTQ
jgi:periplasmic copper chaperone A